MSHTEPPNHSNQDEEISTGILVNQIHKKAKKYLKAKIAAFLTFATVLITLIQNVAPIGSAINSLVTIWNFRNKSEIRESDKLGLYEAITAEKRLQNLKIAAFELNKRNSAVIGVAYYKLEIDNYGRASISYRQDAEIPNGEQTYFMDRSLSDDQKNTLLAQDCLVFPNIGILPDRPKDDNFSAIICPTIVQQKDLTTGLLRNRVANVTAIAIDPDKILTKEIRLEPFATWLYELSPSFENITVIH